MNPKDEFIAFQSQQNEKVSFALNEYGHVTHIVKRVDVRLYDVFLRLKKLRCVNLPILFDIVKQETHLEVHEEYIHGKTLETIRQEKGPLDDDTLFRIAMDMCHALLALHGTEPPIVHRDIKPENIMEREDGGYVLIDFDAARMYQEDKKADTKLIATVGYAAPEQYGLSQTDVRSDLFSLGVTLYELKTGSAFSMGASCGGRLGRIIAKCTAFEPKKRFQSAEQLLKRLEGLKPQAKRKRIIQLCAGLTIAAAFVSLLVPRIGGSGMSGIEPALSPAVPAQAVVQETPIGMQPAPTITIQPAETPRPSATAQASNAAVSSILCTCEMVDYELSTTQGNLIPFDGAAPVTAQLQVSGTFYRGGCKASTHIEAAQMTACEISQTSVGAKAEITEDGSLTIYEPGVYVVDGFVKFGDAVKDIISATLLVTERPNAYTDCACVLNLEKTRPVFSGDQSIPKDGSPLYLELRRNPYLESRLCTATEHKELIMLMGNVETAPDGAKYGVTEDNRFYTYTPGFYALRMPYFYDFEIINSGCDVHVSE